ncbi:hypothetical protein [Stutzerimonas xanthomarina]|uniref:Uncharacterized protein n=2 Tax=Stutzerimonas xanthomarina TaxID=271420 RepID=A0A1M5MSC3_9GAMM|nr:hypothetical protein [Stutzerimonas xanthomarina]MCP9337647.1 hypothetical protein [Stutzerimonas xanthomarina]SEH86722.1 hypothetical protein SAMN05216535_2361 [Stutzerimonas xanthomarina]SHG80117.1 hypothetical protein SAMN02744645_1456 [Stutzerimonas xanthomarina DSM 18231]
MSSFENFVQCRIVTPLAASATDVALYAAVAPYRLPPEAGGVLVLTDSPGNPSVVEVIRYSHRTGLALYGLQRGQEGTTARDWTGPVFCYQALMAGDFQSILDELNAGIDGKVDKATGQSLMTDAERTKLSGIAAGAQVNTITSVAGKTGVVALAKGDVGLANVDNTSDVNKPVSTAQQTALDGKVGTGDARLTDTREWTATTVAQAEAEAGTATTRRAWTAQRVRQAVAAWWAASAMKTKLDGIASGATANATDAQLRDRETHTGTQGVGTITGLGTAATANVQTGPADTTAGALMAVGAFGLGAAGISIPTTEVFQAPGEYSGELTVTGVPAGVGGRSQQKFIGTPTYGMQLLFNVNDSDTSNPNAIWFRHWRGGSPVGNFKRLVHSGNILGTVSQSAGIPTGAIIERGSNANGEYVKWADGTMECRYTESTVRTASKQISGTTTYNTGAVAFVFPAAFAAAPTVSPHFYREVGAICHGATTRGDAGLTTSGVELIGFVSSTSGTSTGRLGYVARGRWFV